MIRRMASFAGEKKEEHAGIHAPARPHGIPNAAPRAAEDHRRSGPGLADRGLPGSGHPADTEASPSARNRIGGDGTETIAALEATGRDSTKAFEGRSSRGRA